jgi:hypothetical protein
MTIRHAIFDSLIGLTILALPVQYLIDSSVVNLACSCLVFASSLTVLLYLRGTTALEFHPLSACALLGFCVSSQLGALLVQTAARTSLVSSLHNPLYTFGTLAFYQTIAVSMHALYRFFSVRKSTDVHLIRGLLTWAGIYETPSCGALWYLGCVGLPTLLLWHFEGVLQKIALGFSFLVWAPFLIPFYSRDIGKSYCNMKLQRILLVGYSAVIGILGLALNARGIMLEGMVTVGLLYLLTGMRSNAPVTGRGLLKLGALAAVVVAISGPISDLATSMAIARQGRGKVSAAIMMRTTLHIWRQPNVIAAYREDQQAAARFGAYDEYYIANPVLARLVETKFYDTAFRFARTITTDDQKSRLIDVSIRFAVAGVPGPLLHAIGIDIDKDDLDFSMGDYLAYLSRGVPLGGRKTGNMFAQGIALFGPLFPFIYAAICLALFALMDLLTIRPAVGAASISALGMLEIWTYFMGGVTYESLHKVLHLFVRSFEQTVLIYALLFAIARLVQRQPKSDVEVPAAALPQRSS